MRRAAAIHDLLIRISVTLLVFTMTIPPSECLATEGELGSTFSADRAGGTPRNVSRVYGRMPNPGDQGAHGSGSNNRAYIRLADKTPSRPECSGNYTESSMIPVCFVAGILREIVSDSYSSVALRIQNSKGTIINVRRFPRNPGEELGFQVGDDVRLNVSIIDRYGNPYYSYASMDPEFRATLSQRLEESREEKRTSEREALARKKAAEREQAEIARIARLHKENQERERREAFMQETMKNELESQRKPEEATQKKAAAKPNSASPVNGVSSRSQSGTSSDSGLLWYLLGAWLIIVVIGIILGFQGTIVVFRDYNDLGCVFMMLGAPFLLQKLLLIATSEQHGEIILVIVLAFEVCLLAWFFARTFQDNPHPLMAILALLTKIPLSILFVVNLITLIAPEGRTHIARAKARSNALLWLTLLTPIIYALVRNKEGLFNPEQMIGRRRINV